MTECGEKLHAVTNNGALCGRGNGRWFPASPDAPLCDYCGQMYGVAFPAPPGREHTSAGLPYFETYAAARAS